MPIVYAQLDPINNGLPTYAVAQELAKQTVAQFGAVRWAAAGIAGGSCCAAVAVNPNPGIGFLAANAMVGYGAPPFMGAVPLPMFGGGLPFAVAFGNSQMAGGGLVMGPVGGHAERAALTGAGGTALYTPVANNAVLFVELTPCGGCQNWLNGGGGGVPNPYNGVINGGGPTTLNVWWRFVYPGPGLPGGMGGVNAGAGGLGNMHAFHGAAVPLQYAAANGW